MRNLPENKDNKVKISYFTLKDFFKLCLRNWMWIGLCLALSVGIALFYIYRKQPEYKRFEQILVNDKETNNGIDEISNAFSSLGLFSKSTNVYNELLTVTSPAVLYSVADTLHLDMNYSIRDGIRTKTLYGKNQPFIVEMADIDPQGNGSLQIVVKNQETLQLVKFRRYIDSKKFKYNETVEVPASGGIVDTPLGQIKIMPNPNYIETGKELPDKIFVDKLPMQTTVDIYGKKMGGDLADQDADVIELSIEDVSVERALDILNYILIVYNNNWIEDKNRMAFATSKFIDERLRVIQAELGDVDESIVAHMKKTGNPDIKTSLKVGMELGAEVEADLIKANNELSVSRYMKDFLDDKENMFAILPVNLGIESPDLAAQIAVYNELLINRNNIEKNSSAANPLVVNYDAQLQEMRKAITASIDNRLNTLETSVKNLKGEISKMNASMANAPEKNLPLLSEERQQAVKEALYLFLLEKREENELSRKFTADNVRIITPPMGPLQPVAPKKALIIIIAAIIGAGVPIILLYYLDISNTTVRSRQDLESLSAPFAGEIPQVGKKSKIPGIKKTDHGNAPLDVVASGKRDVVNEAFRVVRGNLDFMADKDSSSQVVLFTSINPGSGKSFITYNLAKSYALKKKKVLIIDCDLRHGSASMYVGMPKEGLTSYLSGNSNNWKELVTSIPETPGLSLLPIGKMPPNPAELLEDGRFGGLIEELKETYDLIFLDCPPVNIVVDSQILSQWSDRTVFVIRAGLLERDALAEINEFYEEKKFKNMCVILNGTDAVHSRYYTYGNYQNLN